jgi:hypothetical protein
MADNFESNLDDQRERLKLQKQINEAVKDNVKSFGDLGNYSKTIVDNFKDLQETNVRIKENQKLILQLKQSENEEDKKQAALLEQENRELEKKTKQIREINKEMAKKTPLAAGKALLGFLGDAFTKYLDFDQKARDVAAQIGLGGQRMQIMRGNVISASIEMQKYGVSTTEALEAQQAYSDELGRAVILSDQALTNMSRIGKATGLGMAGMAGLTAEMEAFGLGAEQSSEFIFEMYSSSAQMGLNSAKVIKSFQSNLGLLNKLNFKAGVKGLEQMAKYSEKFKLSMQSVASVADKVFRPEGAIEAAAQLQVLGGSLAAMGDPFQLMYKARNAPEELTKDLAKAAAASATFNKKTGEFEVSAYELDRLKEAANALGLSYDELAQSAKQTAKISRFENMLGGKGLDPEQREALAMMAQVSKDGTAQIQMGFTPDGKANMKDLKSLGKTQLLEALEQKKQAEEAAQQATGVKEQWENLFNQFVLATYPLLEELMKVFKPAADGISTNMTQFITGLSEFIKVMAPPFIYLAKVMAESPKSTLAIIAFLKSGLGSVLWWGVRMLMLGKTITGSMATGGATAAAQISAAMAGRGVVGGGMNTGSQALAQAKGSAAMTTASGNAAKASGMGSLMSSLGTAATILAVGAALMMVAKALDIFADAAIKLQTVPSDLLIGLGVGLGVFVGILSVLAMSGVGEAAALVLLGLGAGMLMIGGAVAIASLGFSVLVSSFTEFFKVIGPNGDSVMKAGIGFGIMAAGIGVLAFALVGLSTSALLAVVGLGVIFGLATSIVAATTSLNNVGGADGITKAVNAINSVDQDKLDALKSLTTWMALLGGTTTIKFDESLTVDGEIAIKGEGTLSGVKEKILTDSEFISKLKDAIIGKSFADRNGGKAGAYNKFA